MENLYNGFTLELPPGVFPLSTDSMVLAHFARLPKNARVLDLGSGCGTLGVLLCAKNPACHVTGIELTELGHNAALENIRRNNLHTHMESICADLRQIPALLPAGTFSCCISNPPYYSGGPASESLPLARRQDFCSTEELFAAAAAALKYGGDFFLVHKPDQLGDLMVQGAKYHLKAKRLCLVRHQAGGPVNLILLAFRKGGRPGLHWEELVLRDTRGNPTEDYRKIYHI